MRLLGIDAVVAVISTSQVAESLESDLRAGGSPDKPMGEGDTMRQLLIHCCSVLNNLGTNFSLERTTRLFGAATC